MTRNFLMTGFICGLLSFVFVANVFAATQESLSAKRIIALSPHAVEILFEIGAGHRIIATVEYADYPEEALNIPRVGSFSGIQLEKIIALQPDLIVAWKSGNKGSDLQKLESLGFNLFYSDPKNINDISQDVISLGKLTNLEKNALKMVAQLKNTYQQIKKSNRNKSKISIFYQLWFKPLRTIGTGSWIESLLKDCGGVNIFSESPIAYPMVDIESILVKNPKVIIIPHNGKLQEVESKFWDNWKMIDAVKNQHVLTVDADLIHRVGPRAVYGLKDLCTQIDKARN